jgi:hypothetical protein
MSEWMNDCVSAVVDEDDVEQEGKDEMVYIHKLPNLKRARRRYFQLDAAPRGLIPSRKSLFLV